MKKKYLFVHQNFPGQFAHVAAALATQGHEVVALGIKGRQVPGVRLVRYRPQPLARPSELEPARDFEVKVARGMACGRAMDQLRMEGFTPDVIVAHPGWGEALFCKDIWPAVRLVVYAEFFYSAEGADYGFDPELPTDGPMSRARLRLKNSALLHAYQAADAMYAPTQWQRSRLPAEFQGKTQVIFDGVDTANVSPNAGASVQLVRKQLRLDRSNEVITFVARNLEPYRGFHIFMRALPQIMARRPQAHCLIVGRDSVSYGAPPQGGGSWREVMLREVGHRLPADRIHFVGNLAYADYLRVLQVSTCHVYLTYPFVLSWSCLEAMSAGCAVVGSRTGPVQEVIEDGVNGLLVDFFDSAAIAESVEAMVADAALRREAGQNARRLVVERYDLFSTCLPRQLELVGLG